MIKDKVKEGEGMIFCRVGVVAPPSVPEPKETLMKRQQKQTKIWLMK